MKTDQPLFLNEDQVRQHLRMADLIPAMEKALIDFSSGKVTQPVRSVINVDPPGGFLGLMPALTPDGLGLKVVTFYPSNTGRGIPTHMATIFLVDPETGTPIVIMDGRLITECARPQSLRQQRNFSHHATQRFSPFLAVA